MNIISECCCDGVRKGVDGAPATGFEGFRVLMWAMTCSILHLIRSMARLRFLSASDRGRPGSSATGAVVPGPACPLSAMWGTEKELGSWAVVSPGPSRRPDPVRARASGLGAGRLKVHPGGAVLPGVEFRLVTPRPAGHGGAVDDQLRARVEPVGGGDVLGQDTGDQGRPGGQGPGDGWPAESRTVRRGALVRDRVAGWPERAGCSGGGRACVNRPPGVLRVFRTLIKTSVSDA